MSPRPRFLVLITSPYGNAAATRVPVTVAELGFVHAERRRAPRQPTRALTPDRGPRTGLWAARSWIGFPGRCAHPGRTRAAPHARHRARGGGAGPCRARRRPGRGRRARDRHGVLRHARPSCPGPLRKSAHPSGVRLRLHEFRHGDEMATAMRALVADVAIGPSPRGLVRRPRDLGDDELVSSCPPTIPSPVATDPSTSPSSRTEGWVHYAPGHGLAEVLTKPAPSRSPRTLPCAPSRPRAPAPRRQRTGAHARPASVIPATSTA